MTKKDIRRYTMAEIKALIESGQYFPTAEDAPEYPVDETFWKNAKRVGVTGTTASVRLELKPSVLERYKQEGPDHLSRMAKVLEDHVAKKAS